jgi:hypothetical protein
VTSFILSNKEPVMDIVQANIDRFKLLLRSETDPDKRAMELRLLAEEQAKQVPKQDMPPATISV